MAGSVGGCVARWMDGRRVSGWPGGSMGGPRNEKGMAGWVGSGGWTDRQAHGPTDK